MILIENIDHADKEWKRADSVPHKSTFVLFTFFILQLYLIIETKKRVKLTIIVYVRICMFLSLHCKLFTFHHQ